jgi:hypothetical protein
MPALAAKLHAQPVLIVTNNSQVLTIEWNGVGKGNSSGPHKLFPLRCLSLLVLMHWMPEPALGQAIRWVKTLEGEVATSVSAEADAVFVTGYTRLEQTTSVDPSGFREEGSRGILRKYDSGGKLEWVRDLASDFPFAVSADRSGVYVAGCRTAAESASAMESDVFVHKFSANGVEDPYWSLRFERPGSDCATDIFADATGIYLTGYTSGTFPGHKPSGGWHIFVQRYSLDRTELWTRQFAITPPGDTTNDFPPGIVWSKPSIAVDSFGVYVAGYIQSQDGQSAFLRRYDLRGTELWTRRFGTAGREYPSGLSADPSGVYVAGSSSVLAGGRRYLFLRKFVANGDQLWSRQFSGPSSSVPAIRPAVLSADQVGVYLAGTASESAGVRNSIRGLDSGGSELWQQRLRSGDLTLQPWAMSAHWRAIYVAGLTSARDTFVAKFDAPAGVSFGSSFSGGRLPDDAGGGVLAGPSTPGPVTAEPGSRGESEAQSPGTSPPEPESVLPEITPENEPPIADAGADQTIECSGHAGATVRLDGSASLDPAGENLALTWDGPFGTRSGAVVNVSVPPGTHNITLTAVDSSGLSTIDEVTVDIQDTTPPELKVELSPGLLWPPEHSLIEVKAGIHARDTCDPHPSVSLMSVSSSEADHGLGDGDKPDDVQGCDLGTDDRKFMVRAERSESGKGRTYTAEYVAKDASGNSLKAATGVSVPHDPPANLTRSRKAP